MKQEYENKISELNTQINEYQEIIKSYENE